MSVWVCSYIAILYTGHDNNRSVHFDHDPRVLQHISNKSSANRYHSIKEVCITAYNAMGLLN